MPNKTNSGEAIIQRFITAYITYLFDHLKKVAEAPQQLPRAISVTELANIDQAELNKASQKALRDLQQKNSRLWKQTLSRLRKLHLLSSSQQNSSDSSPFQLTSLKLFKSKNITLEHIFKQSIQQLKSNVTQLAQNSKDDQPSSHKPNTYLNQLPEQRPVNNSHGPISLDKSHAPASNTHSEDSSIEGAPSRDEALIADFENETIKDKDEMDYPFNIIDTITYRRIFHNEQCLARLRNAINNSLISTATSHSLDNLYDYSLHNIAQRLNITQPNSVPNQLAPELLKAGQHASEFIEQLDAHTSMEQSDIASDDHHNTSYDDHKRPLLAHIAWMDALLDQYQPKTQPQQQAIHAVREALFSHKASAATANQMPQNPLSRLQKLANEEAESLETRLSKAKSQVTVYQNHLSVHDNSQFKALMQTIVNSLLDVLNWLKNQRTPQNTKSGEAFQRYHNSLYRNCFVSRLNEAKQSKLEELAQPHMPKAAKSSQ